MARMTAPTVFFSLLFRSWLHWRTGAWALLWCCLGVLAPAHAHDHITERSWLEDRSGQLQWPQVQQHAMQPFAETLSRGYGSGVVWLRLRIDPQASPATATARATAAAPDGLVLRIRPAYLDEVVVFDPLVPGGRVGAVGDKYHPRLDVMQGADFLMPIARGDAPRDVWLRLTSTSTRQIHVAAIDRSALDALTLRQTLLVSLYLGVVAVLMVWALTNSLLHREGVTGVMGAFALMQLTAGLFGLSTSGILRVFWPLEWSAHSLNLLGSVFAVVVVLGGVLFHVRFLREFQPPRWAMVFLLGMLAFAGFNLLLVGLGRVAWGLQNNLVSILLAPPVCLAAAATGRAWALADASNAPALSRRVLVAFYVVFLLIMVLAATTGLGWLAPTEWTLYISQLQTLVSSALLMLMLQYRAFIGTEQRQQALLSLEKTTLQVAHERHMREEQEKLLACIHSLAVRLKSSPAPSQTALVLHSQSSSLSGLGGDTALTRGEGQLLVAFCRAAGHKLERWQAMQLVDSKDKGLTAASLEMRISALRKKLLHCSAGGSTILTLRGFGYALNCDIEVR